MLDIEYIKNNINEVKENVKNRRTNVDIDLLLELDQKRRSLILEVEQLRASKNKKSKNKPTDSEIVQMKELGDKIKVLEDESNTCGQEYLNILLQVPNMTHAEVPVGKDESENVVVREIGDKPKFSFTPKDHLALGELHDIIDMPRGARTTGARFGYIKGDLALLEFALIQHVFSIVTNEQTLKKIQTEKKLTVPTNPFIPIIPPVMIKPEVMQKMGRLEPREERYHIPSDDLYLVGSAEHTLGPLHMDETVDVTRAIRYIGFSTSFRREAGSYGKDTRGIFRVHQFDKMEMESFSHPENSLAEQDFIVAIQEHIMQTLGIPYRVVLKCTGDMGAPDYREFDIEAWIPSQEQYRETHTSDHMGDYQSRRLHTKTTDGLYVHTNDATAVAIGRTLIAIMENYQEEDGHILIPKVLQPYMFGKKSI